MEAGEVMGFKLGSKLKCKVTGFEGIATGHCEYITGCDTYCLNPGIDKDGKLQDTKWFDDMVLKVLEENAVIIEKHEKPGGGPNPPSK